MQSPDQQPTDTRTKLGDAKYWLVELRAIHEDRDLFRRVLDAFLAAARGVPDYAKSEYGHNDGFEAWHKAQLDLLYADSTCGFLFAARDRAIHRHLKYRPAAPAQTHRNIHLTLTDYLSNTDRASFTLVYDDGTTGPTETTPWSDTPLSRESEATVEYKWLFDERPGADVVTLCADMLAKLEQFVIDCESRFSPATTAPAP